MNNDIQLELDAQHRGRFFVADAEEVLAKMDIAVMKDNLVVYHTEVSEKLRGLGIAAKLLNRLVGHARDNKLKIVPLCPFVHAQFKRHPDQYEDVWNKDWHG
jgi:uncharacterized protein